MMRMKSIVGWYTRNKNVPGPPFIYYFSQGPISFIGLYLPSPFVLVYIAAEYFFLIIHHFSLRTHPILLVYIGLYFYWFILDIVRIGYM